MHCTFTSGRSEEWEQRVSALEHEFFSRDVDEEQLISEGIDCICDKNMFSQSVLIGGSAVGRSGKDERSASEIDNISGLMGTSTWGPRVSQGAQSLLDNMACKEPIDVWRRISGATSTIEKFFVFVTSSLGVSGFVNFISQSEVENICENESLLLKRDGISKLGRHSSLERKEPLEGSSLFKNLLKSSLQKSLSHDWTARGFVLWLCSVILTT